MLTTSMHIVPGYASLIHNYRTVQLNYFWNRKWDNAIIAIEIYGLGEWDIGVGFPKAEGSRTITEVSSIIDIMVSFYRDKVAGTWSWKRTFIVALKIMHWTTLPVP